MKYLIKRQDGKLESGVIISSTSVSIKGESRARIKTGKELYGTLALDENDNVCLLVSEQSNPYLFKFQESTIKHKYKYLRMLIGPKENSVSKYKGCYSISAIGNIEEGRRKVTLCKII